jgi:hypothetical protein
MTRVCAEWGPLRDDAWCFPTLDVSRKNDAPGGESMWCGGEMPSPEATAGIAVTPAQWLTNSARQRVLLEIVVNLVGSFNVAP